MNKITFPRELTNRQQIILFYLAKGLMYKEIADAEQLSLNTIKNHCKNIYRNLNKRNRTEAVNYLHEINSHHQIDLHTILKTG